MGLKPARFLIELGESDARSRQVSWHGYWAIWAVKTYRDLYPQICDFENLYWAYRKARKGKRAKAPVAAFEQVQEDELLALQGELQTRRCTPGPYRSFYIHEPKRRLISVVWNVPARHETQRQPPTPFAYPIP